MKEVKKRRQRRGDGRERSEEEWDERGRGYEIC